MCNSQVMNQFKNLFPLIVAVGVFYLASNSPMWKKMNELRSEKNEIKPVPVKVVK